MKKCVHCMLKLLPVIIQNIYLYQILRCRAEILGKCNEHISFRKSPSVVPRWGKECLLSTICNICNF